MNFKKGRLTTAQAVVITAVVVAVVVGSAMYFLLPTMVAPKPEKEFIKIGMTISSTGAYSYASLQGFKGIQVWVEDVNSRGGIYVKEYGKKLPVKLIIYDDRSDKEQVVRLYEKLITEDKIDIAIAPFGSTLTMAASAITEKHKVLLVIWSAASDTIYEQGYKYLFSATEVPNSLMPKPEIEHMKSLGVKSIAIIYQDEPFPAGMAKYAKQFAEEAGIEVVMFEKYSTGTKDFSTLILKARDANPDAFYFSSYLGDQAIVLRQMKELDVMFPYVYMVYSGQLSQWIEAVGEDGLYIFGHTLFDPSLKYDVNAGMDMDTFIAKFKEMFPQAEPDFQTGLAYGAGVILEKVIEHVGSLDPDKLRQAANELSGKITLLIGPYILDPETGKQLGCPFVVTQVQKVGGEYKLVIVWPKDVATGEAIYPIPSWKER